MTPEHWSALRAADKLLAHGAPYEEIAAALDACAAMPGAEQILPGVAQRRVVAVQVYLRGVVECRAALLELAEVEPDPVRRAWSTVELCRRHAELAREFLPRIIADLVDVPDTATVPELPVSRLREHAQAVLAAAEG